MNYSIGIGSGNGLQVFLGVGGLLVLVMGFVTRNEKVMVAGTVMIGLAFIANPQ